jgi:hypothetical protein
MDSGTSATLDNTNIKRYSQQKNKRPENYLPAHQQVGYKLGLIHTLDGVGGERRGQ